MKVYLIDGTYELFRHYYALPSARDEHGMEVAAVRGVLASMLGMIKAFATHIAGATNHVIESFRNSLWPGYETSEGVEPDLLTQFPLLEDVLTAAGIVVWPMVKFEADDARCRSRCGRSRRTCRTRDHLHPGQGPCPMRARFPYRPTESSDATHVGRGWRGPESLVSRRHPSPTIWRWWAMRRTAIRD